MHRNLRRLVLLVVVSLLVIAGAYTLWPKDSKTAATNQSFQVVAGENFWGNITAQIGGTHVQVISIISDPSTDPHLYESDARDAAALAKAKLVIKNGIGYDDFMDKLMAASPNKQRQVLTVGEVLQVGGDNPNPHVWYDTPRIPSVAAAIEKALAAQDPAHAQAYATNLASFNNSLQPILDTINQIKTKYPGAPVAYTERVPGYLLQNAQLSVKTPSSFAAAIEEGNDPSPIDTATMESLMTTHTVRVLLYNSQATSAVTQHIRDLAQQNHIPIVGVTETMPPGEPNYQTWQLHQAQALLKALGG
ncbi:MAG: periplasmic solute binding protein [Candidatus Saccharibacteria bacterium]|nr:periplasmic solute binding protein [Candidatus Saccharibacteria bacterium]